MDLSIITYWYHSTKSTWTIIRAQTWTAAPLHASPRACVRKVFSRCFWRVWYPHSNGTHSVWELTLSPLNRNLPGLFLKTCIFLIGFRKRVRESERGGRRRGRRRGRRKGRAAWKRNINCPPPARPLLGPQPRHVPWDDAQLTSHKLTRLHNPFKWQQAGLLH